MTKLSTYEAWTAMLKAYTYPTIIVHTIGQENLKTYPTPQRTSNGGAGRHVMQWRHALACYEQYNVLIRIQDAERE